MTRMSEAQHKAQAPSSVCCVVVTISDTRTSDTDASGKAIADMLTAAGHKVSGRAIVKDDADQVRAAIERHLAGPDVQVIITTGGTGITSRDSSYEAITALLQKRLDGFGELFRMLSYEQIASGAMLSRAVGGLAGRKLLFAMPGSTKAVELAMTKLILPEMKHLIAESRK